MAAFSGWAAALLKAIDAPVTKANVAWLQAWQRSEGGGASFNPLNTTQSAKGASDYNSLGVKNYRNASEGTQATAQTLLNGRYGAIVSALRSGNPSKFLGNRKHAGKVTTQLATWGSKSFAATINPNEYFLTDPLAANVTFGRVDQGLDVVQKDPYVAVGAGTITAIGGFAEGEAVASHTAVYETLTHPITINGRTYDQVYYAETKPLVKVGDPVTAGQPIEAGGSAELGFGRKNSPAAPLVGGMGAGSKQTQAGLDFKAAALSAAYMRPLDPAPYTTETSVNTVTGETATQSGGGLFSGLESWLAGIGKLVLAYVLLIGVAGALFVTGMKNLGMKTPKLPAAVPVPA